MKPSPSLILVSLIFNSVSCSNFNWNAGNPSGINTGNGTGINYTSNSGNMQQQNLEQVKEIFFNSMLARSLDQNLCTIQTVMTQHHLQMQAYDMQIQQLQQARMNQEQLYATYMAMAQEGLVRQQHIMMAQARNAQPQAHMQQPTMHPPQLKTQVQMMQFPVALCDFSALSSSTVNHRQPVQMTKYTPTTQKPRNDAVSVSNEVTECSLDSVSSSSPSSLIEKRKKKVRFAISSSDTEDTPMPANVPNLITRRIKKAKNRSPAVTLTEPREIEAMGPEEIDARLGSIKGLRENVRNHDLLKLVLNDLESAKKRPRK